VKNPSKMLSITAQDFGFDSGGTVCISRMEGSFSVKETDTKIGCICLSAGESKSSKGGLTNGLAKTD
jgi:hypothetical protein